MLSLKGVGSESLVPDFFFEHQNIIELEFDDYRIASVSWSITQCPLLQRIDIVKTSLRYPPAILFAVPALRMHPENILFGEGERCTKELMKSILQDSARLDQKVVVFVKPNGEKVRVNVSSEVTVRDFICLVDVHLGTFIDDLMLRRTITDIGKHTIYEIFIPPEDLPITTYFYPTSESYICEFSLEFRFTPKLFRTVDGGLELFKKFVRRISFLSAYDVGELQEWISLANTGRIMEIDTKSDKLSHLYFTLHTRDNQSLKIVVTHETIKIVENDVFGFYVDPTSLHLVLDEESHLILLADDHAYQVDLCDELISIFKICQIRVDVTQHGRNFDFEKLGTQAKILSHKPSHRIPKSSDSIGVLKAVRPQYFNVNLTSHE